MNSFETEMSSGLYIHIPFCLSKCPYCNFYSETSSYQTNEILSALLLEMEMYIPIFKKFDSVYIGGGTPSLLTPSLLTPSLLTPSLLTPSQICMILTEIRKNFFVMPESEITMEINPADTDEEYLSQLYTAGVNRLSIGVQSFDDNSLFFLGRRHSAQQARETISSAIRAGFKNISIDLIYGTPTNDTSWLHSLREACSYNLSHISCYQLTIGEDTPLGKRYAANEFRLPDEEKQRRFFLTTSYILQKAGYIHYEVSSFAKNSDLISMHNSKYWNRVPYLGLGPSANSFLDNKRWWNKASISDYITDLNMEILPIESSEILTKDEMLLEALFLGMRTKKGVDLEYIKSAFDYDMLKEKYEQIISLEKEGLIRLDDFHLRPTPAGLAVADKLCII